VEARTTRGTNDVVEALYRAQGDRIWRAIVAYAQDPELASDAVAEAFAQAIVRGPALRSPLGWVWRSAFRIAAGMLKERSRSTQLVGSESYEMPETTTDLVASLAKLPPKQRAAVILFYYADYPISEIADILRSNPLAVRVNLSRGRKRLGQIAEVDHA
jgi:RNA polymerase sigma-70 factor (ECF subfamily)